MTTSSLHFKTANESDIPTIVKLIHELAAFEHLTHEVEVNADILTESICQRHEAIIKLAMIDDEIIGYAVLCKHFSTFKGKAGIYLDDLYIRKEYRAQGYGKALFTHIVQYCTNHNHPRLEWVCLDWNQRCIDFYEQEGAEHLKDYRMYRLEGNTLQKFIQPE